MFLTRICFLLENNTKKSLCIPVEQRLSGLLEVLIHIIITENGGYELAKHRQDTIAHGIGVTVQVGQQRADDRQHDSAARLAYLQQEVTVVSGGICVPGQLHRI